MKTNRGIHKALSMLLCCVMLLGLLPMTALAATVKRVDVTINAPKPASSSTLIPPATPTSMMSASVAATSTGTRGQIVTFLWRYMSI